MSEFKQRKKPYLGSWSEIIGKLVEFTSDNRLISIRIGDNTLTFPGDSVEAKYLRERLGSSLIGKKIGILRTDLKENPVRIRLIVD